MTRQMSEVVMVLIAAVSTRKLNCEGHCLGWFESHKLISNDVLCEVSSNVSISNGAEAKEES